jgi:hypothetical protein
VSKLTLETDSLRAKLQQAMSEKTILQRQIHKDSMPFIKSKKKFEELNPARKCHKIKEVKNWLVHQFAKLLSEWKVSEVCLRLRLRLRLLLDNTYVRKESGGKTDYFCDKRQSLFYFSA